MANKKECTAKQVIAAIKGTGGIKAKIAENLGVSRWTVDRYIAAWESVAKAYQEERELILDVAETQLIGKIRTGDFLAIKYYLSTQGKNRGYVERQERTGKDGEELSVAIVRLPSKAETAENWAASHKPEDTPDDG